MAGTLTISTLSDGTNSTSSTNLNVYSFSSSYNDTPLCCVAVFSS